MKKESKKSSKILSEKIIPKLKVQKANVKSFSPKLEKEKLLKELKLYQVELQAQNEELCQSRNEAENATEKYKALFDYSPGGIFTVDQNGRIEELNLRAAELLGKDRSEFKNKNFKLFVSNSGLLIFNNFLLKIFSIKGKASCEVMLKTKDNKPLYVSIEGHLIEKSEKCYCFMVDITEKLLIEKKIIESEEKFHSMIENSSDIITMIDENGLLKYTSPSIKSILGFEENEIVGKKFLEFVHPDDFEQIANDFKTIREKGGVGPINEFRFLNKKGKYVYLETQGNNQLNNPAIKSMIANARDISERKKAEKQLQINEKKFHDIFNYSQALICTHDMKGCLLTVNPAACHAFEYKAEELVGKNFVEFLPEQDVSNFEKQYLKKVNAEGESNGVFRIVNKVGQIIVLLYHNYKVQEIGEEPYVVGFSQDITERVKIEKELKKSFRTVTEQNKRLLSFSYIVSHNLLSHTSNIKSLLDFLEEAESLEEKQEMIQHLKTVSASLNETMVNLNEVVSIQTTSDLVTEPLCLSEYVNKAINVLGVQIANKNAQIINNVSKEIIVNGNPAYLGSILFNFISNAIKYSAKERPPIVSIDCYKKNETVLLQISDNGIGIDLKVNGDKLFGLYKTFNGNKDAKGVGLFICKNQIEAMGGKVEVESKLNEGSTFKIYLK